MNGKSQANLETVGKHFADRHGKVLVVACENHLVRTGDGTNGYVFEKGKSQPSELNLSNKVENKKGVKLEQLVAEIKTPSGQKIKLKLPDLANIRIHEDAKPLFQQKTLDIELSQEQIAKLSKDQQTELFNKEFDLESLNTFFKNNFNRPLTIRFNDTETAQSKIDKQNNSYNQARAKGDRTANLLEVDVYRALDKLVFEDQTKLEYGKDFTWGDKAYVYNKKEGGDYVFEQRGEYDFNIHNLALIEVFHGNTGKADQIDKYLDPTHKQSINSEEKPVILYAPSYEVDHNPKYAKRTDHAQNLLNKYPDKLLVVYDEHELGEVIEGLKKGLSVSEVKNKLDEFRSKKIKSIITAVTNGKADQTPLEIGNNNKWIFNYIQKNKLINIAEYVIVPEVLKENGEREDMIVKKSVIFDKDSDYSIYPYIHDASNTNPIKYKKDSLIDKFLNSEEGGKSFGIWNKGQYKKQGDNSENGPFYYVKKQLIVN